MPEIVPAKFPLRTDSQKFEIESKQLKVYTIHAILDKKSYSNLVAQVSFLRFVIDGTTTAEFSPRVNEFEGVVGESLYTAIQKNIVLYYSIMVAEIQPGKAGIM